MNIDKISLVFNFLKENRKYNKAVQELYYSDIILSKRTVVDKVTALLHHVANTQSQPNIDKLAAFYKLIYANRDSLNEFRSFLGLLNRYSENPTKLHYTYEEVFSCLHGQTGWGRKTSALFTKSIYHLHNEDYSKDLMIWEDAPKKLLDDEHLFLPVDAVIEFIFSKLGISKANGFTGINNYLKSLNCYNGDVMEVWDDLWFWGFITQKGGGDSRIMAWNENKYWALLHTEKDIVKIDEIRLKAKMFIDLLDT
jgi:hypothetical protein